MLPCVKVPDKFLQQSYRLVQVSYNTDDVAARHSQDNTLGVWPEQAFCPSPAGKPLWSFAPFGLRACWVLQSESRILVQAAIHFLRTGTPGQHLS